MIQNAADMSRHMRLFELVRQQDMAARAASRERRRIDAMKAEQVKSRALQSLQR